MECTRGDSLFVDRDVLKIKLFGGVYIYYVMTFEAR